MPESVMERTLWAPPPQRIVVKGAGAMYTHFDPYSCVRLPRPGGIFDEFMFGSYTEDFGSASNEMKAPI